MSDLPIVKKHFCFHYFIIYIHIYHKSKFEWFSEMWMYFFVIFGSNKIRKTARR